MLSTMQEFPLSLSYVLRRGTAIYADDHALGGKR